MTTNPWTGGVLSRKFVELIGVTINASCTNLDPEGTRRHIRAALHEGATRDEILMVLKMASILSIHTCALGGPVVLEEASEASLDAAGVGRAKRLKKAGERTPAIDKMRALKQWSDSWDPLVALAPVSSRSERIHMRVGCVERDADEFDFFMEVLKLCVVQGVQSCNLGVPILAEELSQLSNASESAGS
jgi:hypothetical protein